MVSRGSSPSLWVGEKDVGARKDPEVTFVFAGLSWRGGPFAFFRAVGSAIGPDASGWRFILVKAG